MWCVLVFRVGSAAAMPASGEDVPAPMCDPDGASVAAGEDIPEVDRGHFEALPCEAQLLLASWRPDAPELGWKDVSCNDGDPPGPRHRSEPLRPRYEGACELRVSFPTRAEPVPAVFSQAEGLAPSRGHTRAPFRPPVSPA